MKSSKLVPLAVFGALAFGTLAPHAQNAGMKIGYVDVQALLKAHPKYGDVDTLNKQAQTALKPTADQLKAIQDKGQNASAAERQQYETLAKTYQTNAQKWQDQINTKLQPLTEDINKAVAATAAKQGFSMILDKNVAASSGLVIYADTKSLDLTDAVVKTLKP